MKLAQQQVEAFHEEGYLVVEGGLEDQDLGPLIEDLDALVDEVAQELHTEGKIANLYQDEPFKRRIACLSRETGSSLQGRVSLPTNLRPPLFDFLHNQNLLDMLEDLVGPEIYCNPTHHVRPKLPEETVPTDWVQASPFHQDAAVLLPEADDTLVITTWIPLVDSTPENGTLQIYPGLHKGEIRRHEQFPTGWGLVDECLPEGEPLTLSMKKGDLIFIHCRTPHGSQPNRTDAVRWSLDLRFHDARKPAGRPQPGLLVRSRENALPDRAAWVESWDKARADKRPKKMYRWPTA